MIRPLMTAHRSNRSHNGLAVAVVAIVTAVASLAGCTSDRAGRPRPQFEVTPVPARSFVIDWRAGLDLPTGQQLKEIHLTGDRVFAYTDHQVSYVLSRQGGSLEIIHKVNAPGGTLREPLVVNNQIIYVTGVSIETYDLAGNLVKSLPLENQTRSDPVVQNELVYVGLDYPRGGRLAAIELFRQYSPIRWEVQTNGGISAKPGFLNRHIFVASEDGAVYAVNDERQGIWYIPGGVFRTGGPIMADLKVDQTGVYVASTDGTLYALDPVNGRIKWQYYGGSNLLTAPVVTEDRVYQYSRARGMASLDKHEGKYHRDPLWTVQDAIQFLSQDARYVYLRGKDDSILAVDKQTGQVAFRSEARDYELFTTNLQDARIFAAQRNGLVVAITPVLREGTVGEIVMDFEAQPLAMAQ